MIVFVLFCCYFVNLVGCDFVVGDLYGCVDVLCVLLYDVCFDLVCDWLFLVGDFVDCGLVFDIVFDLFDWLWCYVVCGNYEEVLSFVVCGKLLFDVWCRIGGDWGVDLLLEWLCVYVVCVDVLLFVWVIGDGLMCFNVLYVEFFGLDVEFDIGSYLYDVCEWLIWGCDLV